MLLFVCFQFTDLVYTRVCYLFFTRTDVPGTLHLQLGLVCTLLILLLLLLLSLPVGSGGSDGKQRRKQRKEEYSSSTKAVVVVHTKHDAVRAAAGVGDASQLCCKDLYRDVRRQVGDICSYISVAHGTLSPLDTRLAFVEMVPISSFESYIMMGLKIRKNKNYGNILPPRRFRVEKRKNPPSFFVVSSF